MTLISRQAAERRGRRGEALASAHLRLRGYRILARNLRTPPSEVDILALHRGDLVVVEVKARASWEACEDALSHPTRRRLDRACAWLGQSHWARRRDGTYRDVRLDAVLVKGYRARILREAWHCGD